MGTNFESSTCSGLLTKYFTLKRLGSMIVSSLARDDAVDALFGGVGGFDKQLGFFDDTVRSLFIRVDRRIFVAREEILRELAARELVEKDLCIVEACTEFLHDVVRIVADVGVLRADERACR